MACAFLTVRLCNRLKWQRQANHSPLKAENKDQQPQKEPKPKKSKTKFMKGSKQSGEFKLLSREDEASLLAKVDSMLRDDTPAAPEYIDADSAQVLKDLGLISACSKSVELEVNNTGG